MKKDIQSLFYFFLLSITIHVLGITIAQLLHSSTPKQTSIIKIKTIGIKKGEKYFSMPHYSVSDLGIKNFQKIQKKNTTKPDKEKISQRSHFSQQIFKNNKDYLKGIKINRNTLNDLRQSNFGIHFKPPQGVSKDKLNSIEKVYYAFQKRVFQSYVKSFISTYQNHIQKKVLLRKFIKNYSHSLKGKIIFDKNGYVNEILIIKSSPNDQIHKLFEDTLTNISSIPNPPKSIINSNDTFEIYFQLDI